MAASADDDTASAGTAVTLVLTGAPHAVTDVAKANVGRTSVRSNLFKKVPLVKPCGGGYVPRPMESASNISALTCDDGM